MDMFKTAPVLVQQLQAMQTSLLAINDSLKELKGQSQDAVPRVEDAIVEINIASDPNVSGKSVWQDNRKLRLVRVIVGTDTAGRFALRIGEGDTSRRFRLAANSPLVLVAEKDIGINIPRGMNFTIVPDTGNPAWEMYAWAIADQVVGTTNARQ